MGKQSTNPPPCAYNTDHDGCCSRGGDGGVSGGGNGGDRPPSKRQRKMSVSKRSETCPQDPNKSCSQDHGLQLTGGTHEPPHGSKLGEKESIEDRTVNESFAPFVQIILEFANNVLVSGVAHVVYSRLVQRNA